MKEYIVEFKDIVKYKFKIKANNEKEAEKIVSNMCIEEFVEYEVDRDEYTPTKVYEVL